MLITKANGEQEEFNADKLHESLTRAGASHDVTREIIDHIEKELTPGITTSEIYRHAFEVLKRYDKEPIAARYSLRRAIMDLGPSGFAFESLLAEIYAAKGYTTEIGAHLKGKCVEHEVDVVAEKPDELAVVEAKFHNSLGFKTDLKVALYIHARAQDLEAAQYDGRGKGKKNASFFLITNTKFTRNAIHYGKCAGLPMIGWNYPRSGQGNLQDMIDETGLHPLTCLSTLGTNNKRDLFKQGIVLCRDIKGNRERLKSMGLSDGETDKILEEADMLCVPNKS